MPPAENRGLQGPVVIVAQSGRALARSASGAGVPVHVLDLCADRDTEARSVSRVGSIATGFEPGRLLEHLRRLKAREGITGIVTGSGFEGRIDLLEAMAGIVPLLGNPPEVVRRSKDPEAFFPLLARLGIPHPETFTVAPPGFDGHGWLFKEIGAAGGAHVRPAGGPCPPGHYLQREASGRPHSAVFLADGRQARVLSYNAIRVAGGTGSARFRYSGAVTIPPPALAPDLEVAIDALVPALGLLGLCGLDFLLDGNGAYAVLELNPRPTATFELYEDLHEDGPWPFALHLAACRGQLPRDARLDRPGVAAHVVLWAQETLRVPGDLLWPDWARDRPVAGTLIRPGDPICTVHARAARRAAVEALLAARQARLGATLARPLAA